MPYSCGHASGERAPILNRAPRGTHLVARLSPAPRAPAPHLHQEQHAQQQVTEIGEYVVEVGQHARRMRAQEVVVANVQRARHVQYLRAARSRSVGCEGDPQLRLGRTHKLESDDELHHGQRVEDGDGVQRVQVTVGARGERARGAPRQCRHIKPRRQPEGPRRRLRLGLAAVGAAGRGIRVGRRGWNFLVRITVVVAVVRGV